MTVRGTGPHQPLLVGRNPSGLQETSSPAPSRQARPIRFDSGPSHRTFPRTRPRLQCPFRPKERAWYDSHRSQILFSDLNSFFNLPNLLSHFFNPAFPAFSGYSDSANGFYKVYSDLLDKIHKNEINFVKKLGLGLDTVREAPKMGNLQSPVKEVRAFYKYRSGFCTVMDLRWPERETLEELKREYNERVREMAEFVRKKDKRDLQKMVNEEEEEN
ncbi:hypothetical protein Patl1_18891 [Pistacia atlantica]|uniref:Uncharacterized protein n=1 Tax=Pistacia atlantica TaxID=434234 RepID=A0ACC1C383_9ROSI|nr:hypothetical protein Patl1_18891 [Pistacia atlantica]